MFLTISFTFVCTIFRYLNLWNAAFNPVNSLCLVHLLCYLNIMQVLKLFPVDVGQNQSLNTSSEQSETREELCTQLIAYYVSLLSSGWLSFFHFTIHVPVSLQLRIFRKQMLRLLGGRQKWEIKLLWNILRQGSTLPPLFLFLFLSFARWECDNDSPEAERPQCSTGGSVSALEVKPKGKLTFCHFCFRF